MRLFIICSLIVFVIGKNYRKSTDNCKLQDDPKFPQCKAKISWMQGNWQSDPFYKNNGVDGSLCSIINYLSKVEKFCPCAVPIDSRYPECANKVSWMLGNWQSNPFYKNNGVDGSVCSIITYLSEIEKFCPCAVPINSQFPICQNKVSWMLGNWQSNPFYKNNGVDGSVCSIITYLSKVEKFCPCTVPINSQFPFCQDKVSWMLGNWQSNPFYKNNGVDGSVCSIVTYLSKVEKFCPCTVPINSQFPFCQNKVSWMQGNWKSNPFYKDNGVDGSLCSILIYLSKVEKWCPL